MLEEERAARAMAGKAPAARAAQASTVRVYPGGMRGAVVGAERLVTLKGDRGSDGSLKVTHSHSDHAQPAAASQLPTE
jgi:hypothetical protein